MQNLTRPLTRTLSDGLTQDLTSTYIPPPITLMPLVDDLELALGAGSATFTRSTTGTFIDKDDGLLKTAAIDAARFETNGVLIEGTSTNEALHNRDFTNAVHVKINITALKDASGIDGIANSASTLTSTAANGTAFQTITKAITENTYSIDVRRKTGAGTIEISDDGGSTFTDITASINAITYQRFQITTTQANPSIGLRIVASGDEIEVDYSGLEVLPFASSRIGTTTIAVTRTADNMGIDAANIPGPTVDYSVAMTIDVLGTLSSGNQGIFNVDGESFRRMAYENNGGMGGFSGSVGEKLTAPAPTLAQAAKKLTIVRGFSPSSTFEVFLDTISVGSEAMTTTPTGVKTSLIIGESGSNMLFGHIKNFRIWDIALADQQVAAL